MINKTLFIIVFTVTIACGGASYKTPDFVIDRKNGKFNTSYAPWGDLSHQLQKHGYSVDLIWDKYGVDYIETKWRYFQEENTYPWKYVGWKFVVDFETNNYTIDVYCIEVYGQLYNLSWWERPCSAKEIDKNEIKSVLKDFYKIINKKEIKYEETSAEE